MTEIYWKDLVTDKSRYDQDDIKKFKDKDIIEFKCQICGKPFEMRGRVFKRRFDADGYFRRVVFACQSKECIHKKKSMVTNLSSIKNGRIKAGQTMSNKVKGKTYEELYGVEEAEKKLLKIRSARAAQTGTEHDPRLGKKHSVSAKKKMSEHKKELMQSKEKKYKSRLSEDMLTLHEYHSETLMMVNNLGNKYKWGKHENWFSKEVETYDSSYELAFII